MFGKSTIGALLGLASSSLAASTINKQCQGDICYSINIPDASAAQSMAPVYLQITGPSSYAWIGMGTGSAMAGSKMLIVYQSANGQNVTLSGRSGSGHVMPQADDSVKATLLEGSGIVNGQMVANIRCPSCSTSAADHIYASAPGSLKSDSVSASIGQHQKYGFFSFDLASAKGGDDTNPFTSSTSTTSSGSGTSCTTGGASGTSSGPPSGFPWFGGSRPSGFPGPFRKSKREDCVNGQSPAANAAQARLTSYRMKLMAHGIIAALCFAILFPVGAISIRLFSFPGLVWFHAGLQILTLILFIIAFGLGIVLAREGDLLTHYHPVIGIILFCLLIIQPICGQLHHMKFREVGGRTTWSYFHIWLGRIIITLGIINGGLGFLLANNTRSGPIAYGVIAGIFWVIYVFAAVVGERKRARNVPPKYNEGSRSTPASPREVYAHTSNDYDMPPPPRR